jgi:hypothetical protein
MAGQANAANLDECRDVLVWKCQRERLRRRTALAG